jgi:hypothetical protein
VLRDVPVLGLGTPVGALRVTTGGP